MHWYDRKGREPALPSTSTPTLISVFSCSFQCLSKDCVLQENVKKLAVTCNCISLQAPTFCSTCNNYCFPFRLSGCSQKKFSKLALSFVNYSYQNELIHINIIDSICISCSNQQLPPTLLHVELFTAFSHFLMPSPNFLHRSSSWDWKLLARLQHCPG